MLSKDINCWYETFCSKQEGTPCTKTNICPRYLEMEYLMENSGLPLAKQQSISINLYDDCDKKAYDRLNEIRENIVDFVNNGKNLIIASNIMGNGKTSWSVRLLHKYFDQVCLGNHFKVRGLFIHVPTLMIRLKEFENPEITKLKRNLLDVDLVVWDDILGSNISSYDYNNLLMFVDSRLFAEKSNIFTTNKTDEESFIECIGEKLTSRIYKESEIIILKGEDKRGLL